MLVFQGLNHQQFPWFTPQLKSLVSTTVDKETDRSGYQTRDPQHGSPMR